MIAYNDVCMLFSELKKDFKPTSREDLATALGIPSEIRASVLEHVKAKCDNDSPVKASQLARMVTKAAGDFNMTYAVLERAVNEALALKAHKPSFAQDMYEHLSQLPASSLTVASNYDKYVKQFNAVLRSRLSSSEPAKAVDIVPARVQNDAVVRHLTHTTVKQYGLSKPSKRFGTQA